MKITIPIPPMGKPRMTQRDKWAKRKCVTKYHSFRDEFRFCLGHYTIDNPSHISWTAYFPIPNSWSAGRRRQMLGEPHRQKPDRDNVDKAILDALLSDDSIVSDGTLRKRWDDGKGARI